MNFDAFISHSSRDKAVADAACAALEAAGIRCWIAPRDILPGSDWGASIIEALDQCRVLVLIFSSNANESPQIRREIERVVNRGIPVLPVRIEDIEPTKAMAYFMGSVHWLDALTPPLEAHLSRLAASIRALIAVSTPLPEMRDPGKASQPSSSAEPKREEMAATSVPAATVRNSAVEATRAPVLKLKIAAATAMVMGGCLAAISIMTRDTPDFVAAAMMTALCYWFVYRNLVNDMGTAKIGALVLGGITTYFVLLNMTVGNLVWVVVEAIAVSCMIYIVAELQRATKPSKP